MYAGPAALRGLGHLCKATPPAVAFTPRWHPLQRKLSHHLEPGSSWEGDETLAEVVAKTTPMACARSSQSRQDGKAQLAQSTFRACQVPCGCAKEAKESSWHILQYIGWEGYRDGLLHPVLISGEIHSP